MSRAIHIEGVLYVPASEAGRSFGYSNDYISRLAREQKVAGRRIGKQWFVVPESVSAFVARSEQEKADRAEALRRVRIEERKRGAEAAQSPVTVVGTEFVDAPRDRMRALLQAGCVSGAGTLLGAFMFLIAQGATFPGHLQMSTLFDMRMLAYSLYQDVAKAGGALSASVAESIPYAREHRSETQEQGIVVFDPATTDIKAIEENFSDEVIVVPDADGESGVIVPVFKNETDTEYRYLMVPVDSP